MIELKFAELRLSMLAGASTRTNEAWLRSG